MRSRRLLLGLSLCCGQVVAQVPSELARERAEYRAWLSDAPSSPFAALALQRIGGGLTLGGPGSDIPLPGLPPVRVTESAGRLSMDSGGTTRPMARNRITPLGQYRILAAGAVGRTALTVFGAAHDVRAPDYFAFEAIAIDTVTLVPPAERRAVLLLAPEGIDVQAGEAGTVVVTRLGAATSLTVRRLPGQNPEEYELEIYFRDATNGRGSYPAGRFVNLKPLGNGRYELDFNRARNPFCAYSSVYPCPAPWAGNTIAGAVEAGERYPAPEKAGKAAE